MPASGFCFAVLQESVFHPVVQIAARQTRWKRSTPWPARLLAAPLGFNIPLATLGDSGSVILRAVVGVFPFPSEK